jgi:hypothetical protein
MQFNKLINRYLKEEDEQPSRADRIEALNNLEDPYAAEQAQKERAQLKARQEEEERKQKWLQNARNKWSSPLFPRVTLDDINNVPWGEYSIDIGYWNDVLYTVEYNRGKIWVWGEDSEIEDWEVVSIRANLKNIFGEDYYVIISKERNPDEYERLENKAYEEVVEKEGERLRDNWDGQ